MPNNGQTDGASQQWTDAKEAAEAGQSTEAAASSGEAKQSNEQVLGDNAGVYIPSSDEGEQATAVELDFGGFIISLGTSCLVNLGAIANPETGQTEVDLDSARQTIDILRILKDKTQGNLSTEEENLMDSLLYDLRTAFVEAKKKS